MTTVCWACYYTLCIYYPLLSLCKQIFLVFQKILTYTVQKILTYTDLAGSQLNDGARNNILYPFPCASFIPFEDFGICHFHCFVADKRVLMKEWKHGSGTGFILLCSWGLPLNSVKSVPPCKSWGPRNRNTTYFHTLLFLLLSLNHYVN